MKNRKPKIILPLCCMLLAAAAAACGRAPSAPAANTPLPAENTETAYESMEEQALAAYRELLKAAPAIEGEHAELSDASFDYDRNTELFGTHYDLSAMYDIDHDGIPELIALSIVNQRWTPVSVFTFSEGKAVLLKDSSDPAAHGTFEQQSTANGAYLTYFCGENHIHSVWRGTDPMGRAAEEDRAYALEGTHLTAVDCTAGENEQAVYFHEIAAANTEDTID